MILLVGKDKESTDQEVKNEQANDNQTALNQASKWELQYNQKSDFGKQTWIGLLILLPLREFEV